MKKIIFIEPDAKTGDGHGLDNLIEASLYFSNQKNFLEFLFNKLNQRTMLCKIIF